MAVKIPTLMKLLFWEGEGVKQTLTNKNVKYMGFKIVIVQCGKKEGKELRIGVCDGSKVWLFKYGG